MVTSFGEQIQGSTRQFLITCSEQETILCGKELATQLDPQVAIICLFGDLGAGKTTLIKGIVHALTGTSTEEVSSPTYSYMVAYQGKRPVFHFDLYRLRNQDDFLGLGFEEYLFMGGICCIEWSERITPILPPGCLHVTIEHAGEERRKISYEIPKCPIC